MNDNDLNRLNEELKNLKVVIENMNRSETILSAELFNASMAPLNSEREALENKIAELEGSGAIAQGDDAMAVGKKAIGIKGNSTGDHITGDYSIIAKNGSKVIIGKEPHTQAPLDATTALERYLQHVIQSNQHLQLQGIRSSGRSVYIGLDRIYITLRTIGKKKREEEAEWLSKECHLVPGEMKRHCKAGDSKETVSVKIDEALKENRRLVVLGDPGCGKTTLLRYLALIYARSLSENEHQLKERIGLDEEGYLPILLPLRKMADYIRNERKEKEHFDGHGMLLLFLIDYFKAERINLPSDFFDSYLAEGKAVILLDGLDEAADPDIRRRVSEMINAFTRSHKMCRYVVTSRISGYTDAVTLQENYRAVTVQDFSLSDIEKFLTHWHQSVAISQFGDTPTARDMAEKETRHLKHAIEKNERIFDLAINPLMLTVIALVHQDQVELPDRRAELYAEAVNVLLGKRDRAKGVKEIKILEGKAFDTGDKLLMLQNIALTMHEKGQKEIDIGSLKEELTALFQDILKSRREATHAVYRFLTVIQERSGFLLEREEGRFSFSHLTFQEYLAARAVAEKEDYECYTLQKMHEKWWREVILLEAGYLSTQGKDRTSRLIRSIAHHSEEEEPFQNLILAAECIRDVGENRIKGDLENEIRETLKSELEKKASFLSSMIPFRVFKNKKMVFIKRRQKAAEAMGRIGSEFYWRMPYGEPEWIEIAEGEFWMGEENLSNAPLHQINLKTFYISKTPITNTQYRLFVKETKHKSPKHWKDGRIPKGKENHPVVYVTFRDACAYCAWLSQVTVKKIRIPSEVQWEKAARGNKDKRIYPWGNTFDPIKCNSLELELMDTTPVGIFSEGKSPYGCLDMTGNVWEWTRSLYKYNYPYIPSVEREDESAGDESSRVLRGGAFRYYPENLRCACRFRYDPNFRFSDIGFRCEFSPN